MVSCVAPLITNPGKDTLGFILMVASNLFNGTFEEDLQTFLLFHGFLIVLYIFNQQINETPNICVLPTIVLQTGPGLLYQKKSIQRLSQYVLYKQLQARPSFQKWKRAHSITNIKHFCYDSYCQPTVFEREKLQLDAFAQCNH
jgi:hypothetical protein